jgi:hypothetical protein
MVGTRCSFHILLQTLSSAYMLSNRKGLGASREDTRWILTQGRTISRGLKYVSEEAFRFSREIIDTKD